MLTCCIAGCENRYSPSSCVKFYRIPAGRRPLHVKRRRLWIKAIQQANGSTDELSENARICGDHFISGEISLDTDSKDFVPSVFQSTKQNQIKNTKWNGLRKRGQSRGQTEYAGEVERPSSLQAPETESPLDVITSFMMETENEVSEAIPSLSPTSEPKEKEEALTKDVVPETETESAEFQETFSLNITLPKQLEGLQPNKMHPVVVLSRLIIPDGDYRYKQCNQTFSSVCQLEKHTQLQEEHKSFDSNQADLPNNQLHEEQMSSDSNQVDLPDNQLHEEQRSSDSNQVDLPDNQLHEEHKSSDSNQADLPEAQHVPRDEPSFMCNMCDQSFITSRNLKRHKLLHVKDCRKCLRCGALFCRRHNHFTFWPRPESKNQHEDESFSAEEQDLGGNLSPERMEPSQITETAETPPPTSIPDEPSVPVPELVPKTAHKFPDVGTPVLVSVKPPLFPRPPSPTLTFLKSTGALFQPTSPMPDYPSDFVQPHLPQQPELPPSLKIFSPQFLTSALLDVERNYKYILNKAKTVHIENTAKKEPVFMCPVKQPVQPAKEEKIAYDLEIIL